MLVPSIAGPLKAGPPPTRRASLQWQAGETPPRRATAFNFFPRPGAAQPAAEATRRQDGSPGSGVCARARGDGLHAPKRRRAVARTTALALRPARGMRPLSARDPQ
jgi:hypothetical protein